MKIFDYFRNPRGKKESAAARKYRERSEAGRNIMTVTCFFGVLFLGLIGYYGYFLQVTSQEMIGSSYNARLDAFADRVTRGPIKSIDGQVLAETKTVNGTDTRYYPYEYLYTHSVGYSGKNGRTGLESLGNFYLLSSHVNLLERAFNELSGKKNPGDTLVTTLDSRIQSTASDALGKHRGAVIAMEPDTGRILTMVSQPNFNANEVDARWSELTTDSNRAVLVNRATQGLYPPGSTFKILTLLEYIREHPGDWQNFTFDCSGSYKSNGYTLKCYHGEKHGHQTLLQAFANSCNGAFASIGEGLDTGRFRELAETCGFNGSLPYDLAYSKNTFALASDSGVWEKAQTAIGQGKTQITPLLNLMVTAAIANGGTMMKPYLADHVEAATGQTVKKFLPSSAGSIMSAAEAEALTTYMRSVVTDGTGSAFRDASYQAAGKTGSAETGVGDNSHAWFVGFAPVDDPKIAVCVIAEDGGSGGSVAAPIARKVMDEYFKDYPVTGKK